MAHIKVKKVDEMGLMKLQQSLDYIRSVFESNLRRILKIIDQEEQ